MELAAFIIIITLAGPLIPTTQGLEAPGITSKYTKGRSISIRKNRTTTYQKIESAWSEIAAQELLA